MSPSLPDTTLIQAVATFASKVDHQRRRSLAPDTKHSWAAPNVEVLFPSEFRSANRDRSCT